MSPATALRTVFDWFYANGGTDRPFRDNPTYAGLSTRVGSDISLPSAWEGTLGVAGTLGARGSFRIDGIYRNYDNFYANSVLPGRTVTAPNGRALDLTFVETTNLLDRKYKAIQSQIQYRFTDRLTLGGNYTLSNARGNVEGETSGSGPVTDDILGYTEYKDIRWNRPIGDLNIDQRHKLRLWSNYDASLGGAGRLNIGLLERLTSGSPYSSNAAIDTRPFVTNPGYQTPDGALQYYFGGRGNFKTDTVWATDLSLNYSFPVSVSKKSEFFARFVMANVLGNSAQDAPGNQDVFTASNQNAARSLVAFNPFNETPVEGVNFELSPNFGKQLTAGDFQSPRSYYFAIGFRF